MTERLQHSDRSSERPARMEAHPQQAADVRPDQTARGMPPQRVDAADEPTILGFSAEIEEGAEGRSAVRDAQVDQWPAASERGSDHPIRLVTIRRADLVAGIALTLAGVAAVVSLWLPWRRGEADSGLSLVRRGLAAAGSGVADLGRGGLWEPPAIVLGGWVLFVLGLLMFLPARTHRFLGVVALIVASGATAGVLFRVAQDGWRSARFDLGLWFAVAVAALGVLGALKAMLTTPRVRVRPRRAARR